MDAQVLARWQFGITTVYHFFFVPMTIGTSWMVAILQTRWLRTGDDQWLRLTKFFSKLFLINFAAGVWHHPLLALHGESDFLVIDRDDTAGNCDERPLDRTLLLHVEPNPTSEAA